MDTLCTPSYWSYTNSYYLLYYNAFCKGIYSSYLGVPSNHWGYQEAHSGKAYAGIFFYQKYINALQDSSNRDYPTIKLKQPLNKNHTYYLSFYLSNMDSSYYASSTIGVAFTKDSLFFNTHNQIPLQPKVENPSFNVLSDKINWTKLSFYFVADGSENYMIIGNFKNDQETVLVKNWNDTDTTSWIYALYYLDDVSLVEVSYPIPHAEAGADTVFMCAGTGVQVGTPALAGCNYWWEELTGKPCLAVQNGSNPCLLATTAQTVVNPTQTTRYLLTMQDTSGAFSTDTVTVVVNPCLEPIIPTIFSPNQDNTNDLFVIKNILPNSSLSIYNRWGQLIYQNANYPNNWDGTYGSQPVPNGVYFYHLEAALPNGGRKTYNGYVSVVR